jgi:hypothetical protein
VWITQPFATPCMLGRVTILQGRRRDSPRGSCRPWQDPRPRGSRCHRDRTGQRCFECLPREGSCCNRRAACHQRHSILDESVLARRGKAAAVMNVHRERIGRGWGKCLGSPALLLEHSLLQQRHCPQVIAWSGVEGHFRGASRRLRGMCTADCKVIACPCLCNEISLDFSLLFILPLPLPL